MGGAWSDDEDPEADPADVVGGEPRSAEWRNALLQNVHEIVLPKFPGQFIVFGNSAEPSKFQIN